MNVSVINVSADTNPVNHVEARIIPAEGLDNILKNDGVYETLQNNDLSPDIIALRSQLENLKQMKAERDSKTVVLEYEFTTLNEELVSLRKQLEIKKIRTEIEELSNELGITELSLINNSADRINNVEQNNCKKGETIVLSESPIDVKKHTDWKDDIIYFIMTDRFNDADQANNYGVDKNDLNNYHGGDLQGIIEKLDYIKELGVSSIWITPVMCNQDSYGGYHGYYSKDFFNIDKRLGNMPKFEELIKKAHEKELKIILDIPLNHTAPDHPLVGDPSKYNWFHHNGDLRDWEDQWQAENCSIYGMPDFAQENPEVEKYLIDVAKFWVDKGIDGFRLDAVKNVPLSFWSKFCAEIHKYAGENFLLIGEYFDANPNKLLTYQQNNMDSLFDFPLHFKMREVFAYDQSIRKIAGHLEYENRVYPHPELMSSFIDNHDTKRFLTEAGNDRNKLKLALAFIMTLNRIPTVYYGTEVGMDSNLDYGFSSEASRKDMEWNKDPQLLEYFRKLTSIRNSIPALTAGNFLEMWQDDQVFSYSRMTPEQEAIVILNNGKNNESRDIPLRAESRFQEGTCLKDELSGSIFTVKDRKIHLELNGKQAIILTEVIPEKNITTEIQSKQGDLVNSSVASSLIISFASVIYNALCNK